MNRLERGLVIGYGAGILTAIAVEVIIRLLNGGF
jgi:hypothetical protein